MVTMFQLVFASIWSERKIMFTWTESTLDNKRPHYTCPFNMDHLHMDLFNLPNAHPPIL
jgi:hypothetical protein